MIVKQAELRSNIKKYFDMAYNGETVLVPRKDNKNVIILSELEYNSLMLNRQQDRFSAYATGLNTSVSHNNNETKSNKIKSYLDTTDIQADNLDRLATFSGFQYNWNGNGAEPFSEALIDKVRSILNKIDIQPEIFPSATGVIDFEFTNSRKDFMSIDIGEGDLAEVFIVMYNGQEITEHIMSDSTTINERVRRFYE